MSILLESLSRETPQKDNGVPDIHANHFDDEMMGDDWLIRRVKKWRIIATVLFFALMASWLFFFLSVDFSAKYAFESEPTTPDQSITDQTTTDQTVDESARAADNKPLSNVATLPIDKPSTVESQSHKQSQNQSDFSAEPTVVKETYQPKKRESVLLTTPTEKTSKSEKAAGKIATDNASKSTGTALTLEELSDELRSQFPNIEINSYVVADSREESFVILDGGFYKIDQVIAPDLILREITQEAIVVEFRSQRVKIPNQ